MRLDSARATHVDLWHAVPWRGWNPPAVRGWPEGTAVMPTVEPAVATVPLKRRAQEQASAVIFARSFERGASAGLEGLTRSTLRDARHSSSSSPRNRRESR